MNFKTTDTALATFLIASGHFLVVSGIDYSRPRYEFSFDDSQAIHSLANLYITGLAFIEPGVFLKINKKLLRIIRQHRQWEDD